MLIAFFTESPTPLPGSGGSRFGVFGLLNRTLHRECPFSCLHNRRILILSSNNVTAILNRLLSLNILSCMEMTIRQAICGLFSPFLLLDSSAVLLNFIPANRNSFKTVMKSIIFPKHSLTAVLAAFLPFPAIGQMMPDSTVQVCAYWQKGDRAVYECKNTTTTIDKDGNEKTTKASSETRIFDVIDETENSYVLQTSYKDVFRSDVSLNVGADVLNKVAEGIVIKTQTNEFGTVQGLVNVDELTEAMKHTIPLAVDAALARQDKKVLKELGMTRQGLIDTYTEQLCRPETIVTVCMDDVLPLLFYHGTRLSLTDTYTVKQDLKNPLPNTSGTIQVDLEFWVDEELSDSSSVVIRSYFQVDNEAMMPFLRESILGMATGFIPEGITPEEVEKELDNLIAASHTQATMEQFSATEIDLATGWTIQWWNKRLLTLTSDEGDTQTITEKEVTITGLCP